MWKLAYMVSHGIFIRDILFQTATNLEGDVWKFNIILETKTIEN